MNSDRFARDRSWKLERSSVSEQQNLRQTAQRYWVTRMQVVETEFRRCSDHSQSPLYDSSQAYRQPKRNYWKIEKFGPDSCCSPIPSPSTLRLEVTGKLHLHQRKFSSHRCARRWKFRLLQKYRFRGFKTCSKSSVGEIQHLNNFWLSQAKR